MDRTKDEVVSELEHHKEMIRVLRERRHILEKQAAQMGMRSPPETLMEIESLAQQIREREQEIANLKTIAVEDTVSLAEAEYRVNLVEVWNTFEGHPTVLGANRLELTRMRLGLEVDRAKELEHEIRTSLARETLSTVSRRAVAIVMNALALSEAKDESDPSEPAPVEQNGADAVKRASTKLIRNAATTYIGNEDVQREAIENLTQALWRAVRFDPPTAAQITLENLPAGKKIDTLFTIFVGTLLTDPLSIVYQGSAQPDNPILFDSYLDSLQEGLKARTSEQEVELRAQIDTTIESIREAMISMST